MAAPITTTYTHDERWAIGEAIHEALSDGELLNRQWAKLPITSSTWFRWIEEDAELREHFVRARVNQAHKMVEEVIEHADRAHGETNEEVAARRLMVDTRKWFVTKIAPRIYGDKVDLTSLGQRIGVIALPPETDSLSVILPSETPPNDG